tara:strand:- start:164 stop:526 length:363 start_codon:yes stop_codon:yes gene_type:complete
MSFQDRLSNDANRVFFGAKLHEEDVVYRFKDGSELNLKGIVEVESYQTGAEAENEVNRSIVKLAQIYIPSISFSALPLIYEKIFQPASGITWTIKQFNKEHGMLEFSVTDGDNRRRERIR